MSFPSSLNGNAEAKIAELEARIAALEQTPQTDSLSPNYLTLNPDGSVGATFSGKIKAQGVDLPAGVNSTPPDADRIRWVRQSDGAVVADLYAYQSGAFDALQLEQAATVAGRVASMLLTVSASDGTSSNVDMTAAASGLFGVSAQAGLRSAKIIQSDGTSSFLQLAGNAAQRIVQAGSVIATWPGGSQVSGVVNVNFPVPFPNGVLALVLGGGLASGSAQFGTWNALTLNGFSVQGVALAILAAGVQGTISWVAIGD